MTPDELRFAYGGPWGEHPEWPVSDWQIEVANGDTRRGYWEWVAANIEAGANQND